METVYTEHIYKTFPVRSTATKRSGLREAKHVETTKVWSYKNLLSHLPQEPWRLIKLREMNGNHFIASRLPQWKHRQRPTKFLILFDYLPNCICIQNIKKIKVGAEIWTWVLLLFSLFDMRYFLIISYFGVGKKQNIFVYL